MAIQFTVRCPTAYDFCTRRERRLFYFFLRSEDCKDKSYGDQIYQDLFEKHFWDVFDEEMVALNVERPAHLNPIQRATLGPVTISLGAARGLTRQNIRTEKAELILYGKPQIFRALEWRSDLSEMRGRDEQLEQILARATDATKSKCSIMLISGPGGSGKTRLAVEAASILVDTHGWKGGFLPNSFRDRSKAKEFARVFEGSANGTVLLIDYPEERTSLVEEIYKSINDDEVRCKSKIRIILASRENRETWARKLNDQALHHFHETNLAPASSLDTVTALSIASDVGIRLASRE